MCHRMVACLDNEKLAITSLPASIPGLDKNRLFRPVHHGRLVTILLLVFIIQADETNLHGDVVNTRWGKSSAMGALALCESR
jgi:hypothetical protein